MFSGGGGKGGRERVHWERIGLKQISVIVKDKVINKLLQKLERRNHKNLLSHFGPIKVSPLKYATQ